MTKTLATRAIVVVVCVAAIVVGATYMSTGTPSIASHAGPSVAGGLLREGSTTTTETGMATGTEHGSSSQTKIKTSKAHSSKSDKQKSAKKDDKNKYHEAALRIAETKLVDGCEIHEFQVQIKNNLDVPLYAKSGNPSEGHLQPVGCNNCEGGTCNYDGGCWKMNPGTSNSIYATTSTACKGVKGTFTYGPSAAYTAQTGLDSIVLKYEDGGGPNGDLTHEQQFIVPTDKGYEFGNTSNTENEDKCKDHASCKIYMTVEITASPPTPIPPNVTAYKGSWKAIGSDVTAGLTAGTSWSNSESSTYGTSFTDGLTEGVVSAFGTTKVSASASQSWAATSSNTISQSNSGSYGVSCNSKQCNGRLYQWQTLGEYTSNPSQIVKSCFFTCVPRSTHSGPRCPYPYCETDGCQCCNAVWMQDNNSHRDNHLAPSAGGTCTAGCGKNNVACTYNDECCSGRCNSGGFFPGGTCE